MIHPTAVISENANIGDNVTIGPFCVVDDNVTIGDGCILKSHVVVRGPTRIGKNNKFFQFSSIGEDCQDKKYAGEPTELVIGDDNEFREGVTVHRGTIQDNSITIIGSRCLLMANAHVAHDCVLGDDIILANNVAVAGHVHIDDFVIVGGAVGIHQFCKIGAHAFLGAGGIILRDVPPFVMVSGQKNIPQGINSEGLKRRGFDKADIMAIKRAYKTIYREGNTLEEAISKLSAQEDNVEGVTVMTAFLKTAERGIIR
ncbi:MAG TPA: acyl-ACP--UDP-N-acetylglucosamine O-acyltransferase [Alteromonas australica]|uniref:Acyl-[acyl-carrier-protein]--UDP-N-acetylglucosamine O-acyltransferase n=1 Tax=Alteromonas australica TaxID=589873 RepID=A0A353JKJ1_9ALTE|nr:MULTISPECIES: acyl-ACP--UDP-N-acetylglucosamine O-acyltransferase [Alteromonas]MAB91880.1 acyl-ACP--UDP-N-acetylglucosamine O-acyltransferase [Alteromonas sp.]AJP43136.1 UDP-N-acetylglucosamine acyltransferase [Alteromonas australica]MAF71323.1 acyl-ACP--UDP-N-acetylglucosamine O-acyltransferase [Alteromonas sp.]MAO29587.1 acyl-ACP--UDP-N-acetylglucosamine O-acyltransferase [Alteromonas sp.]MBU32516.1 acyl-ACP--UDP-N-acetylglucosamine O-acyltransferase [Alteromonas sp.]